MLNKPINSNLQNMSQDNGEEMKTYKRICIKSHTITAENGDSQTIERGEEYITSDVDENSEVTVFSTFWVPFSVELFAGEVSYTQ